MKPVLIPNEFSELREKLMFFPEVFSFADDPQFAAHLACLGIEREVGTINDELARFIFDADTGVVVVRDSLYPERVFYQGMMGLRIRSRVSSRLEIRAKHLRHLLHPKFSLNPDGTIRELVLFPELIAQISRLQSVDLVIVRRWAMSTIFEGFDPKKQYYQTNYWELQNNDILLFSELTMQRKIAFLGTHDLIAHIAGIDQVSFDFLSLQARLVFETLGNYFGSMRTPPIASRILPYTIGVVLDDLAQPPTYASVPHQIVLEEMLRALPSTKVFLQERTVLTKFPSIFEKLILASRTPLTEQSRAEVRSLIQKLINEISGAVIAV